MSNLNDVPTDCPTRERAGWTGDGQLTREVTSYNFEMGAFYAKWLDDIVDAQVLSLNFPFLCPKNTTAFVVTHLPCACTPRRRIERNACSATVRTI